MELSAVYQYGRRLIPSVNIKSIQSQTKDKEIVIFSPIKNDAL